MDLSYLDKFNTFARKYGPLLGLITYILREPIQNVLSYMNSQLYSWIFQEININVEYNPKSAYAIKQEFSQYNINTERFVDANDSHESIMFTLCDGRHLFNITETGPMVVILDPKNIKLITFTCVVSMSDFKTYINEIYKKHCAPDSLLMYYSSQQSKWKPSERRPRDLIEQSYTLEMRNVLIDVNKFITDEQNYKTRGIPYKRGYLLYGGTGTGKSTLVQIIAIKLNRPIYEIHLNATGMTDEVFNNLLNEVPPNSIISIDEIDKQMDAIKKNPKVVVTMGGLLTAIDGPQKLNHGNIIIMTANNKDFIEDAYRAEFFRKGRTDAIFHLTDSFIC